MKKEISRDELSHFRQKVVQLSERLRELALCALHSDWLVQGVACEVYRRCGKDGCRCMQGGDRHGPYKVIQVWHNKRSRQMTLRKGEERYFEMAKHYQQQQENRRKIIKVEEEILALVDAILLRRTIWDKEK